MTDEKQPKPEDTAIGKVFVPGFPGSPVGKFNVILASESPASEHAEVGTFITAETSEGNILGTITDLAVMGDTNDPAKYDLTTIGPSPIQAPMELLLAQASVMQSDKQRPVMLGNVRHSTPDEILDALGQTSMKIGMPVGSIDAFDGSRIPISLDWRYVLGPEAQGLIVGGKSGLASKTSFLTVALTSAMQTAVKHDLRAGALIFNTKGTDLLWLDEPPAEGYELSETDLAIYEAMGIDPVPFSNVTVYSPGQMHSNEPVSPREDAQILKWDIQMIWDFLPSIFPVIDRNQNLSNLLNDIYHEFIITGRQDTLSKLLDWFETRFEAAEEAKDAGGSIPFYKSHHIATGRQAHKLLGSLVPKFKGLLTKGSVRTGDYDVPDTGWSPGDVVVIDIAGLAPDIQAVVMSRTIARVFASAEAGTLGVDHLPILTDELNQWAPKNGEVSEIKRTIQGIATRARYSGLALFGAGQMLSQVDTLVRDNSATRSLGLSDAAELASGVYGKLPNGIAESVETLPKGKMLVWHYTFRQPIIVSFPRPACRTGKPDASKKQKPKTVMDSLKMSDKNTELLTEGLSPQQAERIIASADDADQARELLQKARIPDLRRNAVESPRSDIDDDPLGLGL